MSKSSRLSRPLLVITISVLIVIVAIALFFVLPRSPETPTVVAEEKPVVPEPTLPTLPQVEPMISPEVKEPPSVWYGPVTIADLIEECPEPLWDSTLSEKCLSMLEPFFIDLPFVPENGFQWLIFPQRMTYRRIFENPERDRELVLAALQRPECRFEDGDKGIRADLRESCHAESFYVMASYAAICFSKGDSRILALDYDFEQYPKTADHWEEHLTELATDSYGKFHPVQYTRFREDVWHTRLLDHWYPRKCWANDKRPIEIDWEEDHVEYRALLESLLERLTDKSRVRKNANFRNRDYARALNVIAAHLGDFSASLLFVSSYQDHVGYFVSSTLVRQIKKQHPWMIPFERARSLRNWYDIGPGRVETIQGTYTNYISQSIHALMKLDELGIEYEKESFVDQLCRRTPQEYAAAFMKEVQLSCKDAIEILSAGKNVSLKKRIEI